MGGGGGETNFNRRKSIDFLHHAMRLGQPSIPEIMGPHRASSGLKGPIILGTPKGHKIKEGQFATLIVQTLKPKAPFGLSFGCCFGEPKANENYHHQVPKIHTYIHTYIHT
jgi:hypothetical protein